MGTFQIILHDLASIETISHRFTWFSNIRKWFDMIWDHFRSCYTIWILFDFEFKTSGHPLHPRKKTFSGVHPKVHRVWQTTIDLHPNYHVSQIQVTLFSTQTSMSNKSMPHHLAFKPLQSMVFDKSHYLASKLPWLTIRSRTTWMLPIYITMSNKRYDRK